jgi:hypothetical protein
MAFTENLDAFFDTEEFAVVATVNAFDLNVIFDLPTMEFVNGEASVEGQHPFLQCKTQDLIDANARRRDEITVETTDYVISQIRHEGNGTSLVFLEAV